MKSVERREKSSRSHAQTLRKKTEPLDRGQAGGQAGGGDEDQITY